MGTKITFNSKQPHSVTAMEELQQGDCYKVEPDKIVMITDDLPMLLCITGSDKGELLDPEDFIDTLIKENKIHSMEILISFDPE